MFLITNLTKMRPASHQILALNNLQKIVTTRNFLSTPMPEVSQMDSNIKSCQDLHKFSLEKPEIFWKVLASRLDWHAPFTNVMTGDFYSGVKWFTGGKLNVCVNYVDRHALRDPNHVALIFEKDEPGHQEYVTYGQLLDMVKRYAAILRTVGNVKKGDRVIFYITNSPTIIALLLACCRIGAIHSVVFASLSAEALAYRIKDAGAKIVVTGDISMRGGRKLEIKKVVDEALKSCRDVQKVLVHSADGVENNCSMKSQRDLFLHDLNVSGVKDVIEYVESNDPLFILFTSGSTGPPRGLSIPAGIICCTPSTMGFYRILSNGGTSLLFESTPLYPNPGSYWEMVERIRPSHFFCSPTAIRLLMKSGTEWVKKYDRSSLKLLCIVGEPCNLTAWTWFHDVVGEKKCLLVDTWWQTELGSICISPRPSGPDDKIIPTLAMGPFFGIQPIFPIKTEIDQKGPLCIEKPFPGFMAGIWNNEKKFKETYLDPYPPYYFTGDGAKQTKEGCWKIVGRIDDVINVTGHRLGTAEVEDALNRHEYICESAVVSFPHEVKGDGIFAFIILKNKWRGSLKDRQKLEGELKALVKSKITGYAVPDHFLFHPDLPKTRSGKIMRRILRKIVNGEDLQSMGDITTLAKPNVVLELMEEIKKFKLDTGDE